MKDMISDVIEALNHDEVRNQSRERKRTAKAQLSYEQTVEAILCDLVHRELELQGGSVFVSQSNQVLRRKSRYKGNALRKGLPGILKAMSLPELGFVSLTRGKAGYTGSDEGWAFTVQGRQTVSAAGPRLLALIEERGLDFADIGRSDNEEVIILRGEKPRSDKQGPVIEYNDTEETNQLRAQLREINDWLQQANIRTDWTVSQDRRLRRIFNNSDFSQGGRLYGGFWQDMKGRDRVEGIIIDDDSGVELDYGQTGLLLLYAAVGATPPDGDLYDLSESHIPLNCRPGIKKVIQAAINSSKPLKRMPKGTRLTVPKKFTLDMLMKAICKRHPAIAHCFGKGTGLRIMRQESDILVSVLLSLKAKGIVALPIHDAILVRADHGYEARQVMIELFEQHTKLSPEVSMESYGPS